MTADGDDRSPTAEPAAETGQPQYFADDPAVASDPVTIDVSLADTAFTLETDRGVFARGRLDDGTSLLLRTRAAAGLRRQRAGRGMRSRTDRVGDGPSVAGCDRVGRRRERAGGHSARRNAERNRISNITVCPPDEVPADVEFDTIWSNPPIRIGKAELHTLLLRWLDSPRSIGHSIVGRPETPRRRLAAEVVDRPGPAHRADRLEDGLPGPPHAAPTREPVTHAADERTVRQVGRSLIAQAGQTRAGSTSMRILEPGGRSAALRRRPRSNQSAARTR